VISIKGLAGGEAGDQSGGFDGRAAGKMKIYYLWIQMADVVDAILQ
jgi:hypothetical protein